MVSVLKHFGWNRVVVVASDNGVYGPIHNAFQVRQTQEGKAR